MALEIWHDEEWNLGTEEAGNILPDTVRWVDIETRKVEAPAYWSLRRRWQPFMIGIAGKSDPGVAFLTVASSESEKELIDFAAEVLEGAEIRFGATRDFDEMVLRGLFTNARRKHSEKAGRWPNLNSLDATWTNIRKVERPKQHERAPDCESADVPAMWETGDFGLRKIVALHCLRDVVELLLADPENVLSEDLRAAFASRLA
jgi:hypothetical protein